MRNDPALASIAREMVTKTYLIVWESGKLEAGTKENTLAVGNLRYKHIEDD